MRKIEIMASESKQNVLRQYPDASMEEWASMMAWLCNHIYEEEKSK